MSKLQKASFWNLTHPKTLRLKADVIILPKKSIILSCSYIVVFCFLFFLNTCFGGLLSRSDSETLVRLDLCSYLGWISLVEKITLTVASSKQLLSINMCLNQNMITLSLLTVCRCLRLLSLNL